MKKILFLLIALASLTACSDDVVESVSSSSTRMNDGLVYLTVKIIDVGSSTRAEDGGYGNGTQDEYVVKNAYFYFYDEQGYFVSRGEAWNDGAATEEGDTSYPNVEFEGNTVVVLKGLTEVGFPKYMVTVLNRPADFEDGQYSDYYDPAGTLEDMQIKLASESTVGINDESGNFVMSTSSYQAEDETERPYYFVTEIPVDAFQEELIGSTSSNPVEVYVERLAAKVEVGVSENLNGTTITDEDGTTHTAYPLTENIIGDDNVQTEEDIYIEFQGWALNATARQSYIVKNIESTDVWTNTSESIGAGWTWNIPDDYRSFWAMSPNYGDGDIVYPTSSNGNTDADETSSDTWLNKYLKYTSLNDETVTLHSLGSDDPAYCAENTNTPDVLGDSNSSAITSVLLKAQAWHVDDVDGEEVASPITLIRYMGDLYTDSAFLYVAAQELDSYVDGAFYYGDVGETATSLDEVHPFDGRFLTIINEGNGCIGIAINEDVLEEYAWYEYNSIRGVLEPVNETFFFIMLTEMQESCSDFNDYWSLTGEGEETINEYTDGLMYYSIPIEHLNESNKTDGVYDGLLEANYGVVRNHWYSLTINSLAHLGRGIVDENEVIVPTTDDTNYIRASVSILPWKLIENSVIF